MIRLRVAAACAALITALLLQATLISPIAPTLQISLPAVLVAAVALIEGPGAAIAFGFSAGLVADLASTHPAGVLALAWMTGGVVLGAAGRQLARPLRRHRTVVLDALCVGAGCGLAAIVSTLLLLVLRADGVRAYDLLLTLPSATFDTVIALAVVPVVRFFLASPALRVPRPTVPDIDLRPARV